MKAYRVDGKYCDTIFYVGYKNQVQLELTHFFDWEERNSCQQNQSFGNNTQKKVQLKGSVFQSFDVGKSSKKSSIFSSSKSSIQNPNKKQTSIHFLLYDLTLNQYNDFQNHIKLIFTHKMSRLSRSINLHFVMISSREQSLKYIKKIDKFNSEQFQSNLVELYEELNDGMEYELIKSFMQEKFNFDRDETFQWMKYVKIKKLEDFFVCPSMASFQKKQVRKLLTNLSILQKLYEK